MSSEVDRTAASLIYLGHAVIKICRGSNSFRTIPSRQIRDSFANTDRMSILIVTGQDIQGLMKSRYLASLSRKTPLRIPACEGTNSRDVPAIVPVKKGNHGRRVAYTLKLSFMNHGQFQVFQVGRSRKDVHVHLQGWICVLRLSQINPILWMQSISHWGFGVKPTGQTLSLNGFSRARLV